jgi:hypothetical protein
MILAVDIFQARQVSQTGGVGMDGISASPYRMGYQMINRIRGLIQPYSSTSITGGLMAAISTLRGTLATALTNNGVWSTFSFPPATLLANSVVVTPAIRYITCLTIIARQPSHPWLILRF